MAPDRADMGAVVVVRLPRDSGEELRELPLTVRRCLGALTPSRVRAVLEQEGPDARLLLVADTATVGTLDLARDLGVSVIALGGARRAGKAGPRGHLVIAAGEVVPLGEAERDSEVTAALEPGPPRWGRLAVVRVLVLLGTHTQKQVAALVGLSQPRISQIYRALARDGLVSANGRQVLDWNGLVDHWLTSYPGPGGVTTYWFGLAPVGEQAHAVVQYLKRDGQGAEQVLVSGDAAADLLTPWGRPATAVVYARAGADLRDLRLTPCPAAEATVSLTVPQDPGVWLIPPPWRPWSAAAQPLADPLQILHDLGRSRAVDADQTVERLRAEFRVRAQQWSDPATSSWSSAGALG